MPHDGSSQLNTRTGRACAFCAPHSTVHGRTLAGNNRAEAFLTLQPVTPGHTLIVPRRCVASFGDLEPNEIADVMALRTVVVAALEAAVGASGFNYAWNEGEVAGQTVPHFHLHIVPRFPGDTGVLGYDPRRFFYRPGPRGDSSLDALGDLAESIRACVPAPANWRKAS